MFSVELYGRVRHACHVEGLSLREAARRFGIHRNTVRKMLAFAVPPGYRRRGPPARPRLGPFTAVIDRILEEDRSAPPKQRHTAKRIHERLRAEHGFAGGYTIVKDYVRERRARVREVFVPLAHPPGHAQADFGEAVAVVGGVERKIHFFCLDLPHSDAGFVKAYPAERLEAFCDGHNAAFAFFGGVPRSILYDNTRLAVARIRGDGTRERTRGFAELRSHYLFLDRFGRPGKGNDKGKVEGLVGYARRNFLVPVPRADSFAALNAHLEARCRERQGARLRGHEETIGERLQRDLAALQARPAAPYEACERKAARVSAMSLVRFDRNDYSVPTEYGHRAVLVRGHVDEVVGTGDHGDVQAPRSGGRLDDQARGAQGGGQLGVVAHGVRGDAFHRETAVAGQHLGQVPGERLLHGDLVAEPPHELRTVTGDAETAADLGGRHHVVLVLAEQGDPGRVTAAAPDLVGHHGGEVVRVEGRLQVAPRQPGQPVDLVDVRGEPGVELLVDVQDDRHPRLRRHPFQHRRRCVVEVGLGHQDQALDHTSPSA